MTLPMLGLAFVAMIGFVGVSIDAARLQLVQSRLSFALDAAGLAAGSTMNTTNVTLEIQKYLNANFPANYMGATQPQIAATVSADNMVIDLTATTVMPTTFMNVLGKTQMSVSAKSQVTRVASGLELVMALDVTGSMNSDGKLDALKTAAKSLVNILYGNKTTINDLWIGLVPFSQNVNIGTTRTNWIDTTHYATLNWGPTSWAGCLDARNASSGDTVDDPPTVQKYKVYFAPSTDNRPYPYNTSTYTTVNKWVTARNYDGTPKTYASGIGYTLGPNAYCAPTMTAMTANKTTILNAVTALQARGNTHVNLGAIWAWNMLSPRWRGQWGGEMDAAGLPLDYGTKHMNKAAIILTDGDNTMSQQIFTAYGYLSDGRLGTTSNSSTAEATLDNKLKTVCTAMKNKGIYVYTIAFGNPGTTIQTLLKNCASSQNYYFNSPTNADLQTAFNAIADSLSNLRVSK
jgi:Flp pilus assembly protein TadG